MSGFQSMDGRTCRDLTVLETLSRLSLMTLKTMAKYGRTGMIWNPQSRLPFLAATLINLTNSNNYSSSEYSDQTE